MQPFVHPVDLAQEKLLAECVVRRQRRSGPGGHQPAAERSQRDAINFTNIRFFNTAYGLEAP